MKTDKFVEELTDDELEEISGAKKGCGWTCTFTDDCPNSIIVCC
ncbi:type A2 lanthipeptide [Lactobacillus melliventris]|uniref:Lantibiotic n=1 Tax=Lactobacillus melliventris TaxID=1218507 RepID=A0ABX5N316_9LACO|nr:type A2 lanthipeptide [Lactobacillus melliventris]PXY86162.1 type A2 lantipeptide [Lactobacillus melliventris]